MNWISKFIKPKIKSLFEKKSSKTEDKISIIEQWFIVIFAFVFFGSVLNAATIYFFEPKNELFFTVASYLAGFLFGLLAKSKKWGWIV